MARTWDRPHPALGAEDSAAVCARTAAAALRGEGLNVWRIPAWQRPILSLLALLGRSPTMALLSRAAALTAVDPRRADRVSAEGLARWAVSLYRDLPGPFPAVVLGAPSGAAARLADLLGAPFLPQTFLSSFRDPTHPDDVIAYQAHGEALARPILAREPTLHVVNHYDPLHDRFLVGQVNHLRYKLLDLPQAYRRFLEDRLAPDGTVILLECTLPWLQYRIAPRLTFQVGGLGDVPARTFLEGSPEIEALRGRPGGWALPGDVPLDEAPESEWGSLPPFLEAAAAFARRRGWAVLRLTFDHPHALSRWVLTAWRRLLAREGIEPQGVLVEVFTQVAPAVPRRAALLPLWLPWNTRDSHRFLAAVLKDLPPEASVHLLMLPNFTVTPDLTPWHLWEAVLAGRRGRILGVSPRLYPADPRGLVRAARAIEAWSRRHPRPVRGRLPAADLRPGPGVALERL